jgi:hypothetical protein
MGTRNRGKPRRPEEIPGSNKGYANLGLRSTVSSFIANLTRNRDSQNHHHNSVPPGSVPIKDDAPQYTPAKQDLPKAPTPTVARTSHSYKLDGQECPQPRAQRERAPSRPLSIIQTYQPPLMDVAEDTLPELQPIFTFLNSHGNKLYQEGYFLKLDDQDTCKYQGPLHYFSPSNIVKMEGQMRIEPGPNVLRNSSELFCRYGRRQNWTQPARMGKSFQNS